MTLADVGLPDALARVVALVQTTDFGSVGEPLVAVGWHLLGIDEFGSIAGSLLHRNARILGIGGRSGKQSHLGTEGTKDHTIDLALLVITEGTGVLTGRDVVSLILFGHGVVVGDILILVRQQLESTIDIHHDGVDAGTEGGTWLVEVGTCLLELAKDGHTHHLVHTIDHAGMGTKKVEHLEGTHTIGIALEKVGEEALQSFVGTPGNLLGIGHHDVDILDGIQTVLPLGSRVIL